MICINTTARPAHAEFVSRQSRARLRADALPRTAQGIPQRLHGLLRPLASRGRTAGIRPRRRYLTAAPHPRADSFKNTISLDQFAVEQLGAGHALRVARARVVVEPRAVVHTQRRADSRRDTALARLPQLFVDGTPDESSAGAAPQARPEHHGHRAASRRRTFNATSDGRTATSSTSISPAVRELEQRLVKAQDWARRPKPKVDAKPPVDIANAVEVSRARAADVRPDAPRAPDRFHALHHASR